MYPYVSHWILDGLTLGNGASGVMNKLMDFGEDVPQGRVIYNRLLDEIRLGDLLPGTRPTTLMERSRVADACHEHRAILEALNARDGHKAEAEMRAHIEAAQHVRLKSLRQPRVAPGD